MSRLSYHVPRACLAGTAAIALLLVLAFRLAPELVDRLGAWRKTAVERAVFDEWTAAMARPGTPAFVAWCETMASVRSRDRMLPLAKQTLRLDVTTALQAGDRERAVRQSMALLALDDRDLASIGRAGGVLALDPARREEAIALLRRGADAAPDSPLVAPVLVETLAAAAKWEDAARVLLQAAAAVADNRWEIRWSDRPVDRAWVMPVDDGAGRRVARFSLVRRPDGLTFALPWRVAMTLRQVELSIAPADGAALPCDPSLLTASGLLRRDEEWIADGTGDAVLRAPATCFQGHGPWTVVLRFSQQLRLPDWLAAACLGAAGGQVVRQQHALVQPVRDLRRRALAERQPRLCVLVDDRRTTLVRDVAFESGDAVRWSAEWHVPAGAAALAVVIPDLPGSRHRLDRVAARTCGTAADPDTRTGARTDDRPDDAWQAVPLAAGAGEPGCFAAAVRGPCVLRASGELW